ncbi:RTA1-domain-containing protein [Polychaeton citri CBS 116435]|uniref:RTA1-domain-containing protein n=1 Tax=Polychaeton citri CBS 116435 TaxID=1314669 RepID=A0A9P4Q160_9PEZI|nr:RTA1-domain-containing protein [Polychaeton citri CBS 116435]
MAIDPYANCQADPNFDFNLCTLETCCLAQSSFTYIPDFGGNVFFCVWFGLLIIPQLYFGIKHRVWGYMISMIIGLVFEIVGYVGRLQLHDNPWSDNGFLIYLIFLTIAPVFITAAIYLCLTRIIITFNEDKSRVQPKWIAIGFMTSDFLSLVLQGAGGGIADTADTDSGQQVGVDVMIAGLVLQAVSIAAFLLVCIDFFWRCRNDLDMEYLKSQTRNRTMFKLFLGGLVLATLSIEARSIYRVIELWQGFSGKLWNDEIDFMVLDGAMCSFACLLLSILHPGPAFLEQWKAANWTFKSKKQNAEGMELVGSKATSMESNICK